MHRFLRLLILATALPQTLLAADPFSYIDLAYSQQNTDYGQYTDSSSATVKASLSFLKYGHFRGRYHDGNVRLPPNVQQESWATYGLGFHYPLSNKLWLYTGVDHSELKLKTRTERGSYPHIGARYQLNARWQFALEAGESEVVFEDTTFLLETVYQFHPAVGISATLRDYDDLDLTEYEVGIRWFFAH